METAYLHLITNHIPIVGVPLAIAVLLFGLWRKSDDLKTAGFLILVFLGMATVLTFLLGRGGEDFVEEVAGVSEDAIHNHEDFATIALAIVVVTALAAAFAVLRYQGLAFLKRKITSSERPVEGDVADGSSSIFPRWITVTVLLLAILSAGVLGYTGKLGGKIRHSEFYGGAVSNEKNSGNDNPAATDTETDGGKGRGRNRGGDDRP